MPEEKVKNNIYLKDLEILSDVNPLKAGLRIDFKAPICFLVGDNGVGKSTIMECLADKFDYNDDTYIKRSDMKKHIKITFDEGHEVKYVDFHSGDKKFASSLSDNIGTKMTMMRASAGQCTLVLLNSANFKNVKDAVVILDEPCRGLSIKNQWAIASFIMNMQTLKGCQMIVTSHSDIILECFSTSAQYFDVGTGKDVTYKEFMLSQLSFTKD